MVTAEDVRESSPFFRRLAGADLKRLAAIAVSRTYEKGDVVFSEGDAPAYLHTIASGRVKMVKQMPSGKEVILEIMGPGDPLGAVVAGTDPVAVDLAAVRLMGFDAEQIPKLMGPIQDEGPRITRVRDVHGDVAVFEVAADSDGAISQKRLDEISSPHAFDPHFGWRKHIELDR